MKNYKLDIQDIIMDSMEMYSAIPNPHDRGKYMFAAEKASESIHSLISTAQREAVEKYDEWLYKKYLGRDMLFDLTRMNDSDEYLPTQEKK